MSKFGKKENLGKKQKCRRPGMLLDLLHLRVIVRNLKSAESLRNFLQCVSSLRDTGPPGIEILFWALEYIIFWLFFEYLHVYNQNFLIFV